MNTRNPKFSTRALLAVAMLLCAAGNALAVVPPEGSPLAPQAFRDPGLYISSSYKPVATLAEPLASSLRLDLQALGAAEDGSFVDLRTGSWGTLLLSQPLIPGSGKGNQVRWSREAPASNEALKEAAWSAFHSFLVANQAALKVAPGQIGEHKVTVTSDGRLVQIYVGRSLSGVPVRDSFLTAVLSHGNLVLFGARNWGPAAVSPQPAISEQAAVGAAEAHVGRSFSSGYWSEPHLELVPVAQGANPLQVTVGQGLGYRLVWAIGPRFADDRGSWEALVDAQTGKVLAFTDRNHYLKTVKGGVFPVSNDGIGPEGTEQPGQPMPYADLRDANGALFFSDGGGDLVCSNHASPLRTTLSGRFVSINDNCGAIDEPENFPGGIDLGFGPGTDCAVPPGHSPGNTHSSRTGFYEVNRIIEQAKGWLSDNEWLQAQLIANMNIEDTCNAFWNGSTINFYRSGDGCRNTGEIAAIFDHEWGHGMDNNDANPSISAPGEAYADVAAIVRLNTSCIGRGFDALDDPCGGNGDRCTECTGVREVDWAKRASGVPHNLDWINQDPLDPNGIRGGCRVQGAGSTSFGPCGAGTHCEGSVASEGIWDLLKRDLPAFSGAGFALDSNTALEMVTRYFYVAGGALGNWYNCNPASLGGPGTYGDGCNADGAYMNFLAVDDDNGDLTDGTPHMSAIYSAWDRHQMACSAPAVVNSGCAGRPTAAPAVTASPIFRGAKLSWNAVPGATRYWVYRTEGVMGCAFGKTRIAEVAGTQFVDRDLQNGREYFYGILPVGASDSCAGPMSACASVVPGGSGVSMEFSGRPELSGISGGDGDPVVDNCETATVSFNVDNTGEVALTNVRTTRVEPLSHPEITIVSTPQIAASLPACSSAEGTFQFHGAGIGAGETVVFRVHATSDELAPAEISRTVEIVAAESDFSPVASRTWSFDTDREDWRVVRGTFDHDPGLGANLSTGYLKSSSLTEDQCDEIESPLLRLTGGSTLSLHNQFSTEPGSDVTGFYDRANVGLRNKVTGERTTVVPDGGRLYTASGPHGACVTEGQPGWAGAGPAFLQSTWSAGALNPGGAFTGDLVTLDVAYGTDPLASLDGFQFDEVTLTNFEEQVPDGQSDVCRSCTAFDDADSSVGYRSGWHRVEDASASGGGYHRRMGNKTSGTTPVARVVFTGDQITYFFARSSAGGTADIYIDGALRQTLSYFSTSVTPTFGHSVSFTGLGAGSHELRIEHRSGAVYVDGFELCSGGGADASAVQYRSVTDASQASLGATVVRTVTVGSGNEEISVVVEGMSQPLTVQLLSPLGALLASGQALVPGQPVSGLDAAATAPGTYTVQVLNPLGLTGTVKVSVARTVRAQ